MYGLQFIPSKVVKSLAVSVCLLSLFLILIILAKATKLQVFFEGLWLIETKVRMCKTKKNGSLCTIYGNNMWLSTTGNKPHPSVVHKQQHHFSEDDPRAQLAMTSVDPRVHFALVCGAKVRGSWLYQGVVITGLTVSRGFWLCQRGLWLYQGGCDCIKEYQGVVIVSRGLQLYQGGCDCIKGLWLYQGGCDCIKGVAIVSRGFVTVSSSDASIIG